MDRRQIPVEADPLALEGRDRPLPGLVVRQRDDVDEPGALVVDVVGARQLDAVDRREKLVVPLGDLPAKHEDLVQALELPDPDRGTDVVDAVVETEAYVLEPPAVVAA